MKQDLHGLDVIDEVLLKCGDCGLPLIEIVKTETNENRTQRGLNPQRVQFRCRCPKCYGWSFNSKIFEGSTIVAPCKNYQLSVDDTEIVNDNNRYTNSGYSF